MTIFKKIIDREIPAAIVYEDDVSIAFRDVNPQAPTHVLVIPKNPIPRIGAITPADAELIGHLMWVCGEVARSEGIADRGYRVVTNHGDEAGQTVPHLHFHVIGGRRMSWPPG